MDQLMVIFATRRGIQQRKVSEADQDCHGFQTSKDMLDRHDSFSFKMRSETRSGCMRGSKNNDPKPLRKRRNAFEHIALEQDVISLHWWAATQCTELHYIDGAWHPCQGIYHFNTKGWQKCSVRSCDGHRYQKATLREVRAVKG